MEKERSEVNICCNTYYVKDEIFNLSFYSAISEAERIIIRTELLKCFDEPVDAVAFQLAVIVAKIARYFIDLYVCEVLRDALL